MDCLPCLLIFMSMCVDNHGKVFPDHTHLLILLRNQQCLFGLMFYDNKQQSCPHVLLSFIENALKHKQLLRKAQIRDFTISSPVLYH